MGEKETDSRRPCDEGEGEVEDWLRNALGRFYSVFLVKHVKDHWSADGALPQGCGRVVQEASPEGACQVRLEIRRLIGPYDELGCERGSQSSASERDRP